MWRAGKHRSRELLCEERKGGSVGVEICLLREGRESCEWYLEGEGCGT